ncbi:LPXTG cell wall anchor domain-containing protein, partial [Streptococcus mitis]|uniref:LPXTG cell wall anchor domain-containing protein n=1 Tax=Streptococcus mitis TaxID=28037 RepID=UPI001D0ACE5D
PASTPADAPASTPADAPASTPADAPATPAVAPAVAATSQDNTYQAPAAKAEDKKELPNTGGKDNAAVASLGFLGLLLGALPFVKRKN